MDALDVMHELERQARVQKFNERRAKAVAKGLCNRCMHRPARPGFKSCEVCAEKNRNAVGDAYIQRITLGLCSRSGCKNNAVRSGCKRNATTTQMCDEHRAAWNAYMNRRNQQLREVTP